MNSRTININARYYLAPSKAPRADETAFDVIDRAHEMQFLPAIIFSNGTEQECREWVLRNCEEPVEHTPEPWQIEFEDGGCIIFSEHGSHTFPDTEPLASVSVVAERDAVDYEDAKLREIEQGEVRANAALLKATPKLLALLEQYHASMPMRESGKLICEARGWTV